MPAGNLCVLCTVGERDEPLLQDMQDIPDLVWCAGREKGDSQTNNHRQSGGAGWSACQTYNLILFHCDTNQTLVYVGVSDYLPLM